MKYKLRRRMPLGWFWLLLPWWGVSCVDSRYDLDKDIDMTINVGGEYLTFPVGSTDTTFLSKLISLEEDGMLQVDAVTRVYHLTHYGWLNETDYGFASDSRRNCNGVASQGNRPTGNFFRNGM